MSVGSITPESVGQTSEFPNDGQSSLFAGGGEMRALMRAFDWSQTPLGPVSQWPQSLRIAVRILLGTGYPMLICWGSQYTMIYNDGYRPILGKTKHPAALGSPIRQVFPEAMDFIGPRFDNVMARGQDFTVTDQLFILDRNDYLEECYFTFSYSPAPADDGCVGGVLVTALETTERVLDDRRRRTLRDLATEMSKTHSEQDVWLAAATTLVSEPLTVPFAALYSFHSAEGLARLAASAGGINAAMCPGVVDLKTSDPWRLEEALTSSAELTVDLQTRFPDVPATSWGIPPQKAVILPIVLREHRDPAGFLIAGISPRREFDEPYHQFLQRSAEQIATGLTSARAYEQERRRAEALAELDRAKTLFFSNVSHEFRTPLTLMLGPLEELAAKVSPRLAQEQHQHVKVARRNALRLLKLVNTLLDFSRIEAGRVQSVYQPTDLGTFTAEIASVFRSAMEKAGLRFSVQCEPIAEPIYVDRDMWEKIVLNLLSNAFKFTFEGEVAVSLKAVNGSVEFSVRDTGVGIAEEKQARVFERFHRVENARARTYEGTGIGLALVQELVRLHGGTVRLESALGRGSTFTVAIPLGTAHLPADRIGADRTLASTALSGDAYVNEAERWLPHESGAATEKMSVPLLPSAAPSSEAASDTQKELIVLADDNADMRDYLAHLLHEHYKVHAVADGKHAVEAARELHPALVLADVMMPKLDGFGVLNAIRNDPALRSTPVILLSARAGEESRVEGLQAGADDYLVKPFTPRELIARVSAHVKMANLRRDAAQKEARLRAEAERERHRLEELLAQAPAAIGLMSGPEHRWVYVNDEYVRVTGRSSASNFVGKTVKESLPEIETQPFVDLLNEVYRSDKPYVGREVKALLNRSHTGQSDEAYFDFVYQPVTNAEEKVEGILVHAIEVTDKVMARKAIEQSEARLRAIVETTPECVKLVAPDGTMLHMNSAGLSMIGADCPEMVAGRNVYDLIAPEDRERFREFNERICRGERGSMEFDIVGLKGVRRHVETHAAPLQNADGAVVHLAVTRDITERKLAEQALRESEQRLRVVTDATPVKIWMSGTDKLCYYFNKSWLDFVGRSMEQEMGNGWAENVHPDDFERCLQIYVSSFDARQPFEMEYRLRHHSGQYRWILDHGVPRYSPDGTFEGYVGGCLDIHDQKQAEEALRESDLWLAGQKQAFQAAIDGASLPECLNILVHTAIEYFGGAARCAFYTVGPSGTELHHVVGMPEDYAQCVDGFKIGPASLACGFAVHTGEPRVTADVREDPRWKDWLWLAEKYDYRGCWSFPVKTSAGKVVGTFGMYFREPRHATSRDRELATVLTNAAAIIISRHHEAEERARAEEARRRLAAIVESSDDAIVSKDLNGIVTSWNPAAEKMFGYTAGEMVGRSMLTIVPQELHHDEERILATIGRGERIEHFETVRLTKTGERLDVSLTISPLRDETGRIVGAANIARDITRQKKTELALRTSERLASVGRLAATVAHEINNPLEAVTNLVYLANRRAVRDDVRYYLRGIEEEVDRISHLTKQTLGFYRETKTPTATKVGALLESLVSVFASRARNKGIQIHTEIRQDPEIYAVSGEIRQIIANLVSNSVDAVETGGLIRIRVDAVNCNGRHSPGVRITVADNGPGISPEICSKLFEPFFTTKREVGTGLGLWVCKNIVEKHRGSIRVKSSTAPGRSWTAFSVILPSIEQQSASERLRQAV